MIIHATTYPLNPTYGLINLTNNEQLLMDADEQYAAKLHLKALVQSGDYFSEVATRLDNICADLSNDAAVAQLQKIISELLELQDTYRLVARKSQ